jgi:hypothetical protein
LRRKRGTQGRINLRWRPSLPNDSFKSQREREQIQTRAYVSLITISNVKTLLGFDVLPSERKRAAHLDASFNQANNCNVARSRWALEYECYQRNKISFKRHASICVLHLSRLSLTRTVWREQPTTTRGSFDTVSNKGLKIMPVMSSQPLMSVATCGMANGM